MNIFKKGELGLLSPFYLDSLISSILFFAPAFFVIYFNGLGLSLFQIGTLMMMVPLFSLIFEIPTGAIADIYGRKFSVLLGYFLEGLGFLLLFFFSNYYAILSIFALIGMGSTFSSGAKEAWVTDLIKSKKKDFLHRFFVKTQSLDSFGLVVSGIIGAFVVKSFGLSSIWLIAAISYLTSMLILAFGQEYFIKKKPEIKESLNEVKMQTKESISYSRKHNVLFYLLIAGAIFMFASNFNAGLSWIPLLQNLGFPVHAFGYMWSAMAVVGIFAPIIGNKFYKKKKEKSFIITSLTFWIIISISILLVKGMVLAFFILLSSVFFDHIRRPAQRVYFHRFIPDKLRASIGSVETMLLSLAGIIALPLVGLMVDLIGPSYTIALAGLLALPALIVYIKIKEETNNPSLNIQQ